MIQHDSAIWETLAINECLDAGRPDLIAPVAGDFALAPGERLVACGPGHLSEFSPTGDGSYSPRIPWGTMIRWRHASPLERSMSLFADGLGDIADRMEAQGRAEPHWHELGSGTVWVGTHNAYFQLANGFSAWHYASIDQMSLSGPRMLEASVNSYLGVVPQRLGSVWSELLFTCWARLRAPQHRQFANYGWIPPGWLDRLYRAGGRLPNRLTDRPWPFAGPA